MFSYKQISHLPKSEQKEMIHRAQYIAFTELGYSPRAIGYYMICMVLGIVAHLVADRFFGDYVALGSGILVWLVSYQLSQRSIILKGFAHMDIKDP